MGMDYDVRENVIVYIVTGVQGEGVEMREDVQVGIVGSLVVSN